MTEVRRDGKDDAVIEKIICAEFNRRLALPKLKKSKFVRRYNLVHLFIYYIQTCFFRDRAPLRVLAEVSEYQM